jgi:GNAT superfamily N-acetyltransferase
MDESRDCLILKADLANPEHQQDIIAMTAAYAHDAMGNAGPLSADVLRRLVPGLQSHPTTIVFLAYIDQRAVGIATCFLGFSTFTARSLINVHDLAVVPEHRGQGISRLLLEAVEREARERDCARITLEVQERNSRARRIYEAAGFTGSSLFLTKTLRAGPGV